MRAVAALSVGVAGLLAELAAQAMPVYVLVGQSNMQGHARQETFVALGDDDRTRPLWDELRDDGGGLRMVPNVRIAYLTHAGDGDGECRGVLGPGFGARRDAARSDGKVGPELAFGMRVGKAHQGPVLLIKAAWGGKSLHTDFRPPSAGPYGFRPAELEALRRQGKDVASVQEEKRAATGAYYRKTVDYVRQVLADLPAYCPDYDPAAGYRLAGVVWFQGWNDLVDGTVYPERNQPGGFAAYSDCLSHLIRDLRKDLAAPELPFVIGVMGVGGEVAPGDERRRVHRHFQQAMAAPAALPEFQGNVAAVATAPYWDAPLAAIDAKLDEVREFERRLRNKHQDGPNRDGSLDAKAQQELVAEFRRQKISASEAAAWARGASNAGYHYLGSGKTMAQIGAAFADAVLRLQR